MFSKIYGAGVYGVEGYLTCVEADVSDGFPGFIMVGYLSAQVKEAQDRVRTALKNSGFFLPVKKITINLSPAGIKKEGTGFDLAIGVAILGAYGMMEHKGLEDSVFIGELGLDGSIKPVLGVLSRVEAAKKAGKKRCFVPAGNVYEATVIKEIQIVGLSDLRQLQDYLRGNKIPEADVFSWDKLMTAGKDTCVEDFSQINGQKLLRRATEISVAGMHNILYVGPAGTGKTMIAKRIPTIMPSISMEESIQISKIYSICGLLPSDMPLLTHRPFRNPHHSITAQALVGGGKIPKPGEISLASHGILFLDELAEFRDILDLLREPLEEKRIRISRCSGFFEFPANAMIVAAMNPCKCGFYPDRTRCRCTRDEVMRYLGRVSKPLLDRIDICVKASSVTFDELKSVSENESSQTIQKRVEKVRRIQEQRFLESEIYFNSEMKGGILKEVCLLSSEDENFLKLVYSRMGLSARTYEKILKVSRTIADLDDSEAIRRKHLSEAISYCTFKETYWGGEV